MEPTQSVFALVDCNSFYCSCERLFRPDLKNRPVGVLSNNDGCFVSRSKELKALGVKMGAPYFKVRSFCEEKGVTVFSSNFSLYTNISDRVMRTLSQFSPLIEVYSVDEAFLDLSGFGEVDLHEYGLEIKRIVERDTGIPVSVGIAHTKTLAKIANNIAKKSLKAGGVVTLIDERLTSVALKMTKISEIWGVGQASDIKLGQLGIKNALEFRNYKNEKLIRAVFTKVGLQIKDELAGYVRFSLNTDMIIKKEIMCSRSFGTAVHNIEPLKESIANYVTSACEKLRKQKSICSGLEVFVTTSAFSQGPQYSGHQSVKFEYDTSDTFQIINYAMGLLTELYKQGYQYKKAGIRLRGLGSSAQAQLSLFDRLDAKKSEHLMETIDKINTKAGMRVIQSGACGVDNHAWKMKRELKSPRFVTGHLELPKVTT